MGDKKELEKVDNTVDPELDELLDSALEDLTKGVEKKETQKAVVANSTGSDQEKTTEEWSAEFIKQAASQFEANMSNIMGNVPGVDPEHVTQDTIDLNLQRMADAAAEIISNPQSLLTTPQNTDFSSTITQTLQNLSLGAENLQNPFSEQDLMSMFGDLGGNEGNAFLPFMQGMMQSLLSKEVLYPSLKDILDKYPTWLTENKEKLDEAEFDRYSKQKDLMKEVCDELELENEAEGENVKRERFDKVLALMQKMQDLGQPPSELVGEMGTGLQFDPQGMPIIPEGLNMGNNMDQCSIM